MLGAESLAALTYMIEDNGRISRCHSFQYNGVRHGYNQMRHAGTVWAMLSIFERAPSSPIADRLSSDERTKVQRKLGIASEYLFDKYLLSDSRISGSAILSEKKIKLGASALAIVMSLSASIVMKDSYFVRECENLSKYILSQYDGNLLFRDSITTDSYKPIDWRSNYYSAQSIFALILWSSYTNNDSVMQFAMDVLNRLWCVKYGIHSDSHWLMYALSAAYKQTGATFLMDYGREIVLEVLGDIDRREKMLSAPIACQSEAIIQFLEMVCCDKCDRKNPLVNDCVIQLQNNINLQLLSRDNSGIFFASPNRRDVRVDYTQHNLSSIDGYISICAAIM
jgi:hypothetical protein